MPHISEPILSKQFLLNLNFCFLFLAPWCLKTYVNCVTNWKIPKIYPNLFGHDKINLDIAPCSSGLTSLVSLPSLVGSQLLKEDQEELRELLCSTQVLARYTMANFSHHIFFFSFLWRTFLILYAEGFLLNGRINIKLFVQLFWLVTVCFILVGFGIFPLSLLLGGNFAQHSTSWKVCLMIPLAENNGLEGILKRNWVSLATGFNSIMYVLYKTQKANRLVSRLCPQEKMSCIGRYRRNVINYRTTAKMSIFWSLMAVLDVVVVGFNTSYNISPTSVFYVDTVIWFLMFELLPFFYTINLSFIEIPFCSEEPIRRQIFYVHRTKELIPRRPGNQQPSPPFVPFLPIQAQETEGKRLCAIVPGNKLTHHQINSQHTFDLPGVE